MTHDDHDGHPHLHLMGLSEMMQQAQQQAQMQATDHKAQLMDLLDRLSREDINTLIEILAMTVNKKSNGVMIMGLARGIMACRFGTNFDGQTMEEQISAEQMVAAAEQNRDEPPWVWPGPGPSDPNEKVEVVNPEQLDLFNRPDGYPIEMLSPEEVEKAMFALNLRPSEANPGRFICNKCGLEYISIADRDLRDDCHGCMTRESQG